MTPPTPAIPVGARVITVKPDAGQMHLLRKLMNPSTREVYVIAGRRRGKTFTLAVAVAKFALEHPTSPAPQWANSKAPPTKIACVGPDYERGRRIWDELVYLFADAVDRKDQNKLEITFRGGAQVKVYSGENLDSMRGEGFDAVVLDEAVFLNEMLVDAVVMPTLLDRHGRFWAISTTKFGRKNWFNQRFLEAQEAHEKGEPINGVDFWLSPSHENPRIDPADLEREKSRRDPQTVSEEYDCQILDSSSNWLDPSKLKIVAKADIPTNTFNVILVDSAWGKPDSSLIDKRKRRRKDATVIAVVGQDNMGNAYLLDGLWSQSIGPDEAFQHIDSFARKYGVQRLGKEIIADDAFFTSWQHYCRLTAGVPKVATVEFRRGKNWKVEAIRYWAGTLLLKGKMFVEKSCPLWPMLVQECELYNEADSSSDRCNDDVLTVCADILQPMIYQGMREVQSRKTLTNDVFRLANADKPVHLRAPSPYKYCIG